jgi:hypothetical protein
LEYFQGAALLIVQWHFPVRIRRVGPEMRCGIGFDWSLIGGDSVACGRL